MAEGRYVNPFILGFGVAQQIQDNAFRQQVFQQRAMEVQQLRDQQQEQNAGNMALGLLREGNTEAAQKIYDQVWAPKYGPAKLVAPTQKGDVYHLILANGQVAQIDQNTGTARLVRHAQPDLSSAQLSVPAAAAPTGAPLAPNFAQQEIAQGGQPIIAPLKSATGRTPNLVERIVQGLSGIPAEGDLSKPEALAAAGAYTGLARGSAPGTQVFNDLVQAFGGDKQLAAEAYNKWLEKQQGGIAGARTLGAGEAKQNVPVEPGKETNLVRINPTTKKIEYAPGGLTPAQLHAQGYRSAEPQTIQGLQALAPAKAALVDVKANIEDLKKQVETVGGAASAVIGQAGGGFAQRLGFSDVGQRTNASALNLIQHYDRIIGGVRGASSPQLVKILESRVPTGSDTAKMIDDKMRYFQHVFDALEGAMKDAASGGQVPDSRLEAIINEPLGGAKAAPRTAEEYLKKFQQR